MKLKDAAETYTFAFTNKKWNELFDALMESLKEADAAEPVQAGFFGNKVRYAPKNIVAEIIKNP